MTKVRESGQPRPKVWTDFFLLLRRAAQEFGANDPLRLGAATAFFTTFALPPILIVLIQSLGSFYSTSLVHEMLLAKVTDLLGSSATELVEQILTNVANRGETRLVTWLGFGFLLFIATTLFVVIQNSLNQLWQIHPSRATGRFNKVLKERARSLGILLSTGLLSLVAFLSDSLLNFLHSYIHDFDFTFGYVLVQALNLVMSTLILAAWFGAIFRTLSSAHVPWRAVLRGALLTAVLVHLGEFVLSHLLVPRNLGPIYGHASSLVLVLLFVFYCAMIFYFGACFTKVYAHYAGIDIRPKKNAVRYRLVDMTEEKK
jgi:membrane protein